MINRSVSINIFTYSNSNRWPEITVKLNGVIVKNMQTYNLPAAYKQFSKEVVTGYYDYLLDYDE